MDPLIIGLIASVWEDANLAGGDLGSALANRLETLRKGLSGTP